MPDSMLELTGLIYDAVADSSRWPAFLKCFVHAIRARQGLLAIRGSNRDEFITFCGHGWSNAKMSLYAERYAAIDPWCIGAVRWPESAVAAEDLCSRKGMESSVVFREFYAPNDAIYGIGGVILATAAGQSAIAATRGAGDGPFGKMEKSILRPLMPHLKRATLLHAELISARREFALFTDHLNRYLPGFFLTDADARILFTSAAASEMIRLNDGLRVENGRLEIASPRQNAAFRQAVIELSANPKSLLRPIVISRPSQKQAYRMILMPVERSDAIPPSGSIPTLRILVVDSGSRPEPDAQVLCELFSLTPGEARIAGKLALGRSAEEIAAEFRISVETVRTHIKRILSKTSTQRQGELISLILQSLPVHRP